MGSRDPYGQNYGHDGRYYDDRQYDDRQQYDPHYDNYSAPPPPEHRYHPGAHPDSSFNQMHDDRHYPEPTLPAPAARTSPPRSIMTQGYNQQPSSSRSQSPYHNSDHGDPQPRPYGSAYSQSSRAPQREPAYNQQGHDRYGPPTGAYDVADGHQANRDVDRMYNRSPRTPAQDDPFATPNSTPGLYSQPSGSYSQVNNAHNQRDPYRQESPRRQGPYDQQGQYNQHGQYSQHDPYRGPSPNRQGAPYGQPGQHRGASPYGQRPPPGQRPGYNQQRRSWIEANPYDPHGMRPPIAGATFDPNTIADDGDDGLYYQSSNPNRRSMISLMNNRSRTSVGAPIAGAGAIAGAAAAGSSGASLNAPSGLASAANKDSQGAYTAMPGGTAAGAGANEKAQQTQWLEEQAANKKKHRYIAIAVVVVILLAIGGGVASGIIATQGGSKSSGSNKAAGGGGGGLTASQDDGHGLLNKDSAEIKALMNNANLHKVFPGMDYSPINTQYPECLTFPPSQNNVTRDMAVLSQLTNTLRLYGTDCKQTEMTLTAIDRLGLDDMKVWLGVWLGSNETTNNRQIKAMWSLLAEHGTAPFAGVAVGNEVLFRQDLTATALADILMETRQNLSAKNYDLPVATSDLGSNWNSVLASEVDVVMANVHPFFAGVPAEDAAGWTWQFWQDNDVAVSGKKKNVISEVGWPSAGGNNCGSGVDCSSDDVGSVAGIQEMNKFMSDWVCQSLENGTDYFWFEAFDEPWKIKFNEPKKGQNWEDKWGLMDVNRNLKDGVKIPDCGGKTISRRRR